MIAIELAKKYYPVLWSKERLLALVQAVPQKLTKAEYKEVTGEEYPTIAL